MNNFSAFKNWVPKKKEMILRCCFTFFTCLV
jgi:hypothetical protein